MSTDTFNGGIVKLPKTAFQGALTIQIMLLLSFQFGCKLIEDSKTDTQLEGSSTPSFEVVTESSPPEAANPDATIGSPPPEGIQPPNPNPGTESASAGGMLRINGGALATSNPELSFELQDYGILEMKISSNPNCEGGIWEEVASQKTWVTSAINQELNFSVTYLDYEDAQTECFTAKIIHDAEAPEILFTKYPSQSVEINSPLELKIKINDRLTSVKTAQCRLLVNNELLEKPCGAGENTIQFSALPEGHYVFSVLAEDILGNRSESKVNWDIVSTTRHLSQVVQVNDYKKVDILFVIDNSGSMAYEQRNMATRVQNFLSVIRGLDYQIGVTTTDPRSSVSWGDGQLLAFSPSTSPFYVIESSFPEAEAQALIGQTLQRKEVGSGSEQAIYATYRAVDRFIDHQSNHRQLFREGAQFAVIAISDEDESANGPKNDPEKLIEHIHDTFGGQKMFSFHSIITKPGDQHCKSTYGATYGERYQRLSELTGGIVGSVCEMDYAEQVRGIAEGVRNLLKTLTLQCEPLTNEHAVTILKDSLAYPGSFRIDGVNLVFAEELPPGNYQMDYHCLK